MFDIFEQSKIDYDFTEESNELDYHVRMKNADEVSKRYYVSVFLRASSLGRDYKLESYDVLTYLGDLGGLFEIASVVGYLLSGIFVTKMFFSALITAAYKL